MASSGSDSYGKPSAQTHERIVNDPNNSGATSDNLRYSRLNPDDSSQASQKDAQQGNSSVSSVQDINPFPQGSGISAQLVAESNDRSVSCASDYITPMRSDDSFEGRNQPIAQRNALLTSQYDSYYGGMSSDSELTTSGSRLYHQRPYSSQSRVYYAHPVPKNFPASSSRLSNYSDSITINMQSASSAASLHPQSTSSGSYGPIAPVNVQHQAIQPHLSGLGGGQPYSQSATNHPSSLDQQQPPNSSSANPSSLYLLGMMSNEAPCSSLSHQNQPGPRMTRQLPQRPFKQSMSIDQHRTYYASPGSSYSSQSSPAHHQNRLSSIPSRRIDLPDQKLVHQQQHLQQNAQKGFMHELDTMEKQAADLRIFDDGQQLHKAHQQHVSGLPPSGMSKQSPSLTSEPVMSHQQGIIGSISDHDHHPHHHQMSHNIGQPYDQTNPQQYQHHPQLHHQPTDPYPMQHHPSAQRPQQKVSSASADLLPPMGLPNPYSRSANQFKQTMSIDHHQVGRSQLGDIHQWQHYLPRASNLNNEQHQQQQQQHPHASYSSIHHIIQSYDSLLQGSDQQSYEPNKDAMYNYKSSNRQPNESTAHHQNQPGDYNTHPKSYERACSGPSASGNPGPSSQQAHGSQNQGPRSKQLHHQTSDGSSNSNLSSSYKSNQLEGKVFEKRSGNNEHQKTISSASAPSSSHYQSSSHNKTSTSNAGGNHHHYDRQDLLRRGHTSAVITGPELADHGGSQSALSESGDLSLSQASLSGSLGIKRIGLRAASPSVVHDSPANQPHKHNSHRSSGQPPPGPRSESTTGIPSSSSNNSSLTKKSNSATQLSMTGTKKRLGFRKKQVTSFSVHRSEEVAPLEARHLVKQGSSVSEGDSSMSGDSSSRSWSNSNMKQQTPEEIASMSFIDGLGKGQMISRQGLASPYLGDIQLSLCDRRGNLEIEVIRARNLQSKTSKVLPLTYVKLYLVKNRKCLAKAKTTLSNKRTLNPLFQQQLTFHEDYHGCILQSIVWGNFGKMDKKNFMGIAQISIDDLELSDTVISWYKLFLPSSLQTLPSKSLRHTLLSNSTESFTATNNS